ncbi:sodium/hydrogen exchanger 9B2-like isoform X1 [Mercenaria mercenaria]|uniref:sodium/hydrogen exchanger 9B2-like isoform X1 n=1 Tax=Mercenaria mercenaria TaxID=6596 RepID=UPI00234EFE39|nr:sodium/hydrogen exchanger 9B2-like isoform X1 [Mercenaria mercenaria]
MGDKLELRLRDVKPNSDHVINGNAQHEVKPQKADAEQDENCSELQDSCTAYCIPCLTRHNPLPENANIFQKILHGFMLPPHGNLASYFQFAVVCLQVWIILYAWTNTEALPGGNYFSLLVLFICCAFGGYLISFINLPPLLGMLIMGLLLKNLPVIRSVGDNIDGKWSAVLRKVALTVILTRAGLGLDVIKLKKLSWAVLRLAFIPCAAEIVTTAVVSHFLLGFPWAWSLMLGCIMGALSPAVTVPSLVSLQDRRYGVGKGIPTMLLAAGGLDNVLCVTGFSVFFGIIFSDSDLVVTIFKGPIGVFVGIIYGFVAGIFLWYIPAKDCANKVFFRSMLLLGAGLVALFGSSVIKLSGAGPIGCLTTATVAAYKWRQRRQPGEPDEVASVMALAWLIVQHFLFGLIGSAVDVSKIQSSTAGLGIATLAIGLAVRSVLSFTVTLGTGFNIKERVFVTLTWLSKATVQAATGGLAIAEVMLSDKPDPDDVKYGTDVLTISVLAIIICAPIGATLMAVLGPRFLALGDDEDAEAEETKGDVKMDQHILDEIDAPEITPPTEIKPIENNQFKSEISLTLQNRSSKLILSELDPVDTHSLDYVDTDTASNDGGQGGFENPAYEGITDDEIVSENTDDNDIDTSETNDIVESVDQTFSVIDRLEADDKKPDKEENNDIKADSSSNSEIKKQRKMEESSLP